MKRAGFTLIELLIVVAILGTLMALTVAGIGRVQTGQRVAHSRQTVTILQKKLNDRVTQVIEKARSPKCPQRAAALSYCSGDPDLATSVLCYGYIRAEFPETFAEAKTGFVLKDSMGNVVLSIPPPPRFWNIPSGATTIVPGDQNAALLFLIVNDVTDDSKDVGVDSGSGLFFYRDQFGAPIMFRRWYQSLPLTNQLPYCNSKSVAKDPLDPTGKLATWNSLLTLRSAVGCPEVGDNNNKLMTIVSSPLPTGEVVWGYQQGR